MSQKVSSNRVYSLESCTENPCVGGSIPPLGTILTAFFLIQLVNISQPVYQYNCLMIIIDTIVKKIMPDPNDSLIVG